MTQTAAVFKVNISTIIAWKRRYEATGDVKIKIRCPVNKKIIPEKLIKYVEEHPDAYLKETSEVFGFHPSSVLKRLRKLRLREKKEHVLQSSSPQKTSRGIFGRKIKDIPKEKLIYIDDTYIQMQMYCYVRAVNGENGRIFASAASVMPESGLLRHYVKARCLLRTPTAER